MLKVVYTSSDKAVAQKISADLAQAGYEVGEGAPAPGDVLIAVLSPKAVADQAVQDALIAALDLSLHILPLLTQTVIPPRLIDHLTPIDYREGDDFPALRERVDQTLSPDARLPLRVLTPSKRRANRSVGLWLGLVALIVFGIGLYSVGVLHLQAPDSEFSEQYTQDAMTRDVLIAPQLQLYGQFYPKSTQEATNYAPTLHAVPTLYRLFIAETATAIAGK